MSLRRNPWLLWLFALCAIALFVSLGRWQLDRRAQKQAMLDEVARVLHERRAQPLAVAAQAARAKSYDWAAGEGVFDDAPPILLDNQQREGQAGVRAYRVFLPAQGAPLLVELGWLPLAGDRKMPEIAKIEGVLRIDGLLLPPPSHGIGAVAIQAQPSGSLSNGILLATGLDDAQRVREALHRPELAPRVLRLAPELKLGYARDMDVLPNTLPPERHLGYAVQWFALAATVAVTAIVLTVRRFRRSRHHIQAML